MKILFCDDELSLGSLAKRIFLDTDHEFLYTQTIEQSTAAIDTKKFDIIIIDIVWNCSIYSGFDLVDHILKSYGDDPKPLIYITSGFLDKFQSEIIAYKQFIDGAYQKPEELLDLLQSLRS
jgi:DNA-binding response OmpR family regulator